MDDVAFTEHEQGEREALLQLRSFITKRGLEVKGARLVAEIDRYCATRLHDIRMDAKFRDDCRRLDDELRSQNFKKAR